METIYTTTKALIASLISSIVIYFDPVAGKLEALLVLFAINFFVGFFAGKFKNNESFNMKKFMDCFKWAAVILVIVCAFYFIGEHNGDKDGTIECMHVVSLVAIWAFGTNILKNLCKLSKGNDPVYNFFFALYYWLSFDFVKQIPILSNLAAKKGKTVIEEELDDEFVEPSNEEHDEY